MVHFSTKTSLSYKKLNSSPFFGSLGMEAPSIPADVMPLVFQYLDPISLARMANTCHAWKNIVYRSSVWSPFLWKTRWNYSSLFRRREGARHIGEPHALCFLAWATRHLIQSPAFLSQENIELPLSLNSIQDPAKIVRRTYRLWCEKKKPCLHTTHHEWADVCILSPKLVGLRTSEVEQLKHQLCDGCIEPHHQQSPYAMWLQKQIDDYLGAVAPPANIANMVSANLYTADASTLLGRVQALLTEQTDALKRELVQLVRLVVTGFEKSIRALHRHSARDFDEGDRVERKDKNKVWDGTVFTVLPSP